MSLKESKNNIIFGLSTNELLNILKREDVSPTMECTSEGGTSFNGSNYDAQVNKKKKKKNSKVAALSKTMLQERIKFAEELIARYAPSLLIHFMFK